MKFYKLSHIKLRKRIFTGYFLTGFIALIILFISFLSFNNLFGEFKRFAYFSENAQLGLYISRDVIELQRNSDLYMQDGHISAAKQVDYTYKKILLLLTQFKSMDINGLESSIRSIRSHLDSFYQTFEKVKNQRELQSQLLNVEMRKAISYCEDLIMTYQSNHKQSNNKINNITSKLLTHVLLVEKNTYRYFDSLDAEHIKLTRGNLTVSLKLLKQLDELESEAALQLNLKEINKVLKQYRALFVEAVQRTRGYLYMVNVIMAADAYETLYQSQNLAQYIEREMNQIETSISQRINFISTSTMVVGLVFILLISLFSYWIGHSIADPIRHLTQTFRQLAKGHANTPIARYEVNDEIGELTHAAEVFREKNFETRELLKNYRNLSEQLEHKVTERTQELEAANKRLQGLSNTDGLTGLSNRRYFDATFERECSQAVRSNLSIAVLMIDVDYFKLYNDHYGHQAGDDALKMVAAILQQRLQRKTDYAARYGGEEFVAILQDTDSNTALGIAEDIRQNLENKNHPHAKSPIGKLTLSIGVCVRLPEEELHNSDDLLKQADKALYQSKGNGRNRVTLLPFSHQQE